MGLLERQGGDRYVGLLTSGGSRSLWTPSQRNPVTFQVVAATSSGPIRFFAFGASTFGADAESALAVNTDSEASPPGVRYLAALTASRNAAALWRAAAALPSSRMLDAVRLSVDR